MQIQFIVPVEVEAENFSATVTKLEGETPFNRLEIKAANSHNDTFRVLVTVSRKETIVSICGSTGPMASVTLKGGVVTSILGTICEVGPTWTKVLWRCNSIHIFEKTVSVYLYDTDFEELLYATFSV